MCVAIGLDAAVGAASSLQHADDSATPHSASGCTTSELQLMDGPRISEQTQQDTRMLVLRNTSASACTLDGRPTITLSDRGGQTLSFDYRDRGDNTLTHARPRTMSLRPGTDAYFAVNQNACVTHPRAIATQVQVALPGVQRTLSLRWRRDPLFGECATSDPAGRTVDVSPFEPRFGTALGS
jgi:hypothetical protein